MSQNERLTALSHGMRFHLIGGLCFTRVDGPHGGEDEIRIDLVPGGNPVGEPFRDEHRLCTVSLSAWASVVAHLGFDGETAETHSAALRALTSSPQCGPSK